MYDSFSHDYDHFVNWKNRLEAEVPFLIEKITKAISKPRANIHILDAATGTGMHAIAMSRQGFSASGVDISAGMIAEARSNARKNNLDIRFETAGFGDISKTFAGIPTKNMDGSTRAFDAVICLGNSLPHVKGIEELQSALRDFAACLLPGGLLIIQNRNFDAVLIVKDRWMEPQSYSDAEKESLFLRFYDFLPDGHIQFNIVTLQRSKVGEWKQSILETRLFPITRSILKESLDAAGFHQISEYGALSNTPFTSETSGNLVVTAIKE